MDWKFARIVAVMVAGIMIVAESSALASDTPPEWIKAATPGEIVVKPLFRRGGAFKGITSIGPGEDLKIGFTSFYLDKGLKAVPMPKGTLEELRKFISKGDQFAEPMFLPRSHATLLIYPKGKPAERLIIILYEKEHLIGVGGLYEVDDDVYQEEEGIALGADERLWGLLTTLQKEDLQ